jgi:hypothetical protein
MAPQTTAGTAPEAMRLELDDSLAVTVSGATAAFSVDSSVAEASIGGGRVIVVAHSVGSTTI